MNKAQHEILRHALGLGGRSTAEYRNHFVTGPGTTDYPHCEALVAAGLMTRRDGHPLSGGDPIYHVTRAGRDALASDASRPCCCRMGECESKLDRLCRMAAEVAARGTSKSPQ